MATRQTYSSPQIFRQTLFIGIICAFFQTLGFFDEFDRWSLSFIAALQEAPERSLAPLLVTVDDATVKQLGPPPWNILRWRQIATALHEQGISELVIVDPWENLILTEVVEVNEIEKESSSEQAKLKIPNLLRELPGSEGLPSQQPSPPITAPFELWPYQLYLPPTSSGVIQDLSESANAGAIFGPSAFCQWSKCPSGAPMSLPIRPLDPEISLPTLSLRQLLQSDQILSEEDLSRTIILGVTAQWRSQLVRVGVNKQLTHWPLAVSAAITTTRQYNPTPTLGMVGNILIVFFVLGIGSIIVRFTQRFQVSIFVLLIPGSLGAFGAIFAYWNIVHLPIFAIMIAAGLPPLISALEGRKVAMDFMRRVALLVVEDSFRYGWKSTRVKTHDELFLKLAALTRAQTPSSKLAYFSIDFNTKELNYIGGYGIERNQLPDTLTLGTPPFNRLKNSSTPFRSSKYLSIPCAIAPIKQGSLTIGFWIIGAQTKSLLPEPEDISRLTRWLNRHLQIDDVPKKRSIQEWLFDRLEAESVAVQELFMMASEERRRQIRTLHTIKVPIMTADIAGSTLFINTAFREFLENNEIDNIRSIRELVFRLFGEKELQVQMDTLFLKRAPIFHDLSDATGKSWRLIVQSVQEEGVSNAERILGFVAFLNDISDSSSLKNIQDALVGVGNEKVREALSYVSSHAQWLETKTSRPAAKNLLRNFSVQAQTAFQALDAIESSTMVGENLPIQADLNHLIHQSAKKIEAMAKNRSLELDILLPDEQVYVWINPQQMKKTLSTLMLHGVQSAPFGTQLQLHHHLDGSSISFFWAWKGAGLDSFFVGQDLNNWDKHSDVPATLLPYIQAREVFTDLRLESSPGVGVTLRFSLPRAVRSG